MLCLDVVGSARFGLLQLFVGIRDRPSLKGGEISTTPQPCTFRPSTSVHPVWLSSLAATSSLRIANLIGQQRMTRNRCRQTPSQSPCQPKLSRVNLARGKKADSFSFYTTYKIFSASHRAYRAKSCWSPYTQRSLDLGRTGDTRVAFGLYAEEPDPQKSEVFQKSVTEI